MAEIGSTAVRMICSGDLRALGAQFGYAVAFDRDTVVAIGDDLALSLADLGASGLGPPPAEAPAVSYFSDNGLGRFALIEQYIPTDSAGHVLLELIVSPRGPGKQVTLEGISASP